MQMHHRGRQHRRCRALRPASRTTRLAASRDRRIRWTDHSSDASRHATLQVSVSQKGW